MSRDPLSKALCYELYLELGRANRELLSEVQREKPNAHRATLAVAVLCLLDPEGTGSEAKRQGDHFFRSWISKHDGAEPVVSRWSLKSEAENMITEDLLWVGLAVMIAVAGGAFYRLLQRKRTEQKAVVPPDYSDCPTHQPGVALPKPEIAYYALAVFSGKVRVIDKLELKAGDLLTQATYWWTGNREKWERLSPGAGLTLIETLPESDDTLLSIVFSVNTANRETPSSRAEAAMRLREASGKNHLDVIGLYLVGDIPKLKSIGFRR